MCLVRAASIFLTIFLFVHQWCQFSISNEPCICVCRSHGPLAGTVFLFPEPYLHQSETFRAFTVVGTLEKRSAQALISDSWMYFTFFFVQRPLFTEPSEVREFSRWIFFTFLQTNVLNDHKNSILSLCLSLPLSES